MRRNDRGPTIEPHLEHPLERAQTLINAEFRYWIRRGRRYYRRGCFGKDCWQNERRLGYAFANYETAATKAREFEGAIVVGSEIDVKRFCTDVYDTQTRVLLPNAFV
jgi:hypothetical protein